jgi:hypothetical protein
MSKGEDLRGLKSNNPVHLVAAGSGLANEYIC